MTTFFIEKSCNPLLAPMQNKEDPTSIPLSAEFGQIFVEIPCRLLTPHFLMKIHTTIGFVVAILVILRLINFLMHFRLPSDFSCPFSSDYFHILFTCSMYCEYRISDDVVRC